MNLILGFYKIWSTKCTTKLVFLFIRAAAGIRQTWSSHRENDSCVKSVDFEEVQRHEGQTLRDILSHKTFLPKNINIITYWNINFVRILQCLLFYIYF